MAVEEDSEDEAVGEVLYEEKASEEENFLAVFAAQLLVITAEL